VHLAQSGTIIPIRTRLSRDYTGGTRRRLAMNEPYREPGAGVGLIILLVLLYIIFNPIPGPVDDAAVAAIGGYQALKRL
jgi:hypothetical protein